MNKKELDNIMAFWRRVMKDENVELFIRLKASELLVTALGGFPTNNNQKEVINNGKPKP